MLVIRPTSGSAISVSLRISPGTFIPISRTDHPAPSLSDRRSVRGRPMRLFQFPLFLRTGKVGLETGCDHLLRGCLPVASGQGHDRGLISPPPLPGEVAQRLKRILNQDDRFRIDGHSSGYLPPSPLPRPHPAAFFSRASRA